MAIDPGDVVVDGVDVVSAEDHNKQRTALLALETGTTAQTTVGTITTGTWQGTTVAVANGGTGGTSQATAQVALNVPPVADVNSSGAVIKVRGNAVDSGTPNFGQAYVWDGDSFNPTSVTQQILSDAGQQTIGTSSAKTTMLAGTKPVIAANTLAVGDQFQFIGAGAFETVGGAASTLKLDWDLINPTPTTVTLATQTTAQVGITKLVSVRFQIDALVLAIGSSASIAWTIATSVTTNSATLVDVLINHVNLGATTVNSTVALTCDLALTCSANNANNTFSVTLLTGTYTPKFA